MALIYTAQCRTTGKFYVGLTTKTLSRRKSTHKIDADRGKSSKFYNAIRKYGWDDFEWVVVEDGVSVDMIGEAECRWIEFYDSIKNGYNTIPGGTVSPMLFDGVRDKATAAMRENRNGVPAWNRGIPRTEETKAKIRASHALRPAQKSPSPLRGRKLSDEHRAAISAGLKGNTNTKGKSWAGEQVEARKEAARERMLGTSIASANKGKPKTGRALDAVRSNLAKARATYAAHKALASKGRTT